MRTLGLAKLGNIVAETFFFIMFHWVAKLGTYVSEAEFASVKQKSRNTAYGKRRTSFKLDSQRSHWANVLDKMTRLYTLQGKMHEG